MLIHGYAQGGMRCCRRLVVYAIVLAMLFIICAKFVGTAAADEGNKTSFESFDPSLGLIIVPVYLGGKQSQFAIGTCTPCCVVDHSLRKLLRPVRAAGDGNTFHDDHHAELFRAPEPFTAFGRTVPSSSVKCADLSRLSAVFGIRIAGVLGMDFLRDYIIRIDFTRGTCALLEALPREPGVPIPLLDVSGETVANLNIEGVGNLPFQVNMFIGGTQSGTLDSAFADRLMRLGAARRIGKSYFATNDATAETADCRVAKIALGDFTHQDHVFVTGARNTLSFDYFSRYMVTFNFPGKTMYLRPNSRFNAPSVNDLSGAHVYRPGPKTWVHSVDPRSPSEAAGLKPDDVLEAIDSRPAASLTVLQIRKLLCISGEHTLKVTRSGKPLDIRLNLKEAECPRAGQPTGAVPPGRRRQNTGK